MGREEIAALIAVLTRMQEEPNNLAIGTWKISFDKRRQAFVFDKCENEGYCEERPAVIGLDGTVIDAGGPLFD